MQLINPTTNQPIDISTGGGILKINILDYFPEILPILQNLPSSINKNLNVGQSPKAKQFFSKFNIGLYNNINLDNPISYMDDINSILSSIPEFGILQKKVLNMFEIIFDSNIIIPKVNIEGKQCDIPSFVFRSFEP